MALKNPRLKGRSRTVTPVTPVTDPTTAPSTPFEPTDEMVQRIAHVLYRAGNIFPDLLARAAVTTALRVNATSPESRRVPSGQELETALQALLDMSPKDSTQGIQPERPWQQDHEGAAVAMLTSLHRLTKGRNS